MTSAHELIRRAAHPELWTAAPREKQPLPITPSRAALPGQLPRRGALSEIMRRHDAAQAHRRA